MFMNTPSKFTKLSKYAPSLVSDPRDEMSCLVLGCRIICKRSVIWLCYMTTCTFLVLWYMTGMWKRQELGGRVDMPRGNNLLMGVLQSIGFR